MSLCGRGGCSWTHRRPNLHGGGERPDGEGGCMVPDDRQKEPARPRNRDGEPDSDPLFGGFRGRIPADAGRDFPRQRALWANFSQQCGDEQPRDSAAVGRNGVLCGRRSLPAHHERRGPHRRGHRQHLFGWKLPRQSRHRRRNRQRNPRRSHHPHPNQWRVRLQGQGRRRCAAHAARARGQAGHPAHSGI